MQQQQSGTSEAGDAWRVCLRQGLGALKWTTFLRYTAEHNDLMMNNEFHIKNCWLFWEVKTSCRSKWIYDIYNIYIYYIFILVNYSTIEHLNFGVVAANIQSRWCFSAIDATQAYQRDLELAKGSNSNSGKWIYVISLLLLLLLYLFLLLLLAYQIS